MPENDSPDEVKKADVPETEGEDKTTARKKEARDHSKIKALRTEIEELKKSLETRNQETESARAETGEWKDKALRTMADAENLRKRLEREKSEYMQYALAEVLKDILLIIDNLERAIKAHDAPDGFREGVELILKQMSDLAAKRGVTPIPGTDGKFDPSFHHALTMEETDEINEPLIGELLQKGYMLNDRLLRPALVKVLVPKKD
ncbi:MAG: nucleotide exchange factor GrpE [Candidatus Aminicenantes bacterium]|nr:nucleotide exchange factor GrpE [Candidatus Aminicenantes bacterium]